MPVDGTDTIISEIEPVPSVVSASKEMLNNTATPNREKSNERTHNGRKRKSKCIRPRTGDFEVLGEVQAHRQGDWVEVVTRVHLESNDGTHSFKMGDILIYRGEVIEPYHAGRIIITNHELNEGKPLQLSRPWESLREVNVLSQYNTAFQLFRAKNQPAFEHWQ